MEIGLMEKRGGGELRKKKKTLKRNEWVEDEGSFKKNGLILYLLRFSCRIGSSDLLKTY